MLLFLCWLESSENSDLSIVLGEPREGLSLPGLSFTWCGWGTWDCWETALFLSNKTWDSRGLEPLNRFTVITFACLFAYNSETLEKYHSKLQDYIHWLAVLWGGGKRGVLEASPEIFWGTKHLGFFLPHPGACYSLKGYLINSISPY